jgi:transposase InsO family protein
MSEWFTAQQLSGITGLPATDRAIQIRSQKETWLSRPRAAGKGNEYHISSLPVETQRALKISNGKRAAAAARNSETSQALSEIASNQSASRQESLVLYHQLKPYQRVKVDAINCLMSIVAEFLRATGMTKGKAFAEFSALYNRNDIEISAEIRDVVTKCSRASLYRWEKIIREKGIAYLCEDIGAHRRGSGLIDSQPELREYVIGMLVEHPHAKSSTLHKAIRAEFAATGVSVPSERRLCDWVAKWKDENKQVFMAVTNPDAWKNKYMDAQGSASEHVIALNQLWEMDSTPADLMLTDGRYTIIGAIEVYSRRVMFVVMPTSNSKGVAAVIRRSILAWGVPETVKADNGSDYKSDWITGILRMVGVDVDRCPPFQGWKKPHIERVFRTFSHDVAELLPGFIGHNVAERSAIEARNTFSDRLFKKDQLIEVKMSSAELQTFCDGWLEHEYHTRRHSELKCSPNQMAANYIGSIRTITNERALDVLLSEPAGTRTVGKKGIKLNGSIYIHAQLAAHTGDQVNTYYDEADIGRIYVYDIDGNYLCTAEDPAITGVSRTDVAVAAKEIQREQVQERKRQLKAAAKRVTKRDVAQQILDHRAAEERANKVRQFPRPETEHTSAGLTAATHALNDQKSQNNLPAWFDKAAAAKELQSIQTSAPAEKANVVKAEFNRGLNAPTGMAERYQFWADINTKMENGTATEEETKWARNFYGSAAWQSGKLLIEMRTGATGQ